MDKVTTFAGRSELPASAPVVTVAVVTHNSADDVGGFFASLHETNGPGIRSRVVVADNASTDGTVDLVRTHAPDAEVIRLGQNVGYAGGVNAVLERWPGDGPVFVLNPHVRLRTGCLESLLAALDGADVGITVPRLVDEAGQTRLSLRREPSVLRAWGEALLGGARAGRHPWLGEVVSDPVQYETAHPVDWATGAAMLISPLCVRTVGAWNESYFLYSEETDYDLRCRDAGFAVHYVPAAVAQHRDAGSMQSPDLWSRLTLSRVGLFRSRHNRLSTGLFSVAVAVNEALRAAGGRKKHRAALRALLLSQQRRRLDQRLTQSGPPVPQPPTEAAVICFSGQDWWYHNRAHSDFQLMQRVAATRTTLFVNSIGMRMPLPGRSTQPLRRVIRKAASIARFLRTPLPDRRHFHVLSPLIIPFYGVPAVRALNTRLVTWQVKAVSRRLGIVEPVCIVTIPTAWPVVQRLDRRGVVLNRSDKHSEFGETDQTYIRGLEHDLLLGADRVAYVSRALMETEKASTAGRARFLDHGVDLDLFRRTDEIHAEVARLPRPRIGFFGGFDDYVVDMELLARTAKSLPEAQVVLIGDATCSMEPLTSLPNVTWLGFRPHEHIPALGSGFDVALMPWLRNGWIEACNPIKLKEYLALGLPVVSTDFPEVRHYAEWIRIAEDEEDFVELIRRTLDDGGLGTPAGRRAAVAGSSWDRRAQELIGMCDEAGRRS